MLESINDWVGRLASKPLPVMRQTLTRVNEQLNHPHASLTKLSEVVGLDPGFSLYLFQYLYDLPKRPSEPISKISNIISILGVVALEHAVETLPVLEDRLKGISRFGLTSCYSRAAHASVYATGLAQRVGQPDPQLFTTAALLHDIGEMALWAQAPDVMRGIQKLINQGAGRDDAVLEVLGFTYEELNQQLGMRWQLPALVQDSQGLFNSYQPKPLTVMLACAVARASATDWYNRELADYLELLADFLDISQDEAYALIHQYAAEAGRKLYPLPLPLSVYRLLQNQHRTKAAAKPQVTEKTKPAKPTPPQPQITPPQPQVTASQPTLSSKQTTVPSAERKPDTQTNPLHVQLTKTVEDMQQIHGLNNIMFAMLSPDRLLLKARFVASTAHAERLRAFEAKLDEPSLFSIIMKKPQALWFHADNQEKYLPMIAQQTLRSLCNQGFMIMSIFLRNKPIGLFYADNEDTAGGLTLDQFNNFKVSCQRFVQRLG